MLGVAVGIALPVLIAVLSGALSFGPEVRDLTNSLQALQEHYEEDWNTAREQSRQLAYAQRTRELDEVRPGAAENPWRTGFRAGWVEGQYGALAAMQEAAVEQQLGGARIE